MNLPFKIISKRGKVCLAESLGRRVSVQDIIDFHRFVFTLYYQRVYLHMNLTKFPRHRRTRCIFTARKRGTNGWDKYRHSWTKVSTNCGFYGHVIYSANMTLFTVLFLAFTVFSFSLLHQNFLVRSVIDNCHVIRAGSNVSISHGIFEKFRAHWHLHLVKLSECLSLNLTTRPAR